MERARIEYDALLTARVAIPDALTFDHKHARWSIQRTFGTGWTYRNSAYSYDEAMALYSSCVRITSIREVIGAHGPTEPRTEELVEVEATIVKD